jgi:hypothetical protein
MAREKGLKAACPRQAKAERVIAEATFPWM